MRRLLLLCAVLTAVAAGGCNRGAPVRAPGGVVRLELHDYRIIPQRVRVRPGRVTFVVRNTGAGVHDLQLRRRGRVKVAIPPIHPGASRAVTVRLTRGAYRMSCSQPHHEVLGEYGTVSVR